MTALWVVLGFIALILIVAYAWYASLIGRRNQAQQALSSIDVELNKRHDLLPNIVKLAQKFMTHERSLLEELTSLRARVGEPYRRDDPAAVREHLDAARALDAGMIKFFATAENYPELKSADTILRAQETFEEVEGHIAAARRFYNAAVTSLNNAIQIFPGNLIAGVAGVTSMPFYEVEERVRAPVNVDDYMK